MSSNRIKLLYVAGAGRSGSTLLNRILGTLDGVAAIGELNAIWKNGFMENRNCSCGAPFQSCDYWRPITFEAFGSAPDVTKIWKLKNRLDRTRRSMQLLSPIKSAGFKRDLQEYQAVLEQLYRAVAKSTGASVLVDSSKRPSTALILNQIPSLEVHLVHLVRDARAVVYAWKKRKADPGRGGYMPQYSSSRTILFWVLRNLLTQFQERRIAYTRIRYEDFIRQPREVCEHIVNRSGFMQHSQFPKLDGNVIELPAIHMLSGNPGRFSSGSTVLKLDEAWKEHLDAATRRFTTLVTYPLLRGYGYC